MSIAIRWIFLILGPVFTRSFEQPLNTFYKQASPLLMLMIPILGTQLAQTGMGVVDTLVAGMAGTLDLASIAVGSSIWLPLVLFESGIMLALSPLIAQAKGAKDKAQSARHLQQGIYLGLVIGLMAMLVLLFGTTPVMNIMEISQDIQLITEEYLFYIALSLPAVAVHQAFRSYNEAVHLTAPVTIIAFAGLALNVPLNLIFVFGFGPIEAMGGAGCGLASLIVFYMMAIAIWLYTYYSRFHQKVKPLYTFKKPNLAHMQHIFKIGLPIGLAIFAEVSLFCIIALFIARLGPDIVAAHQITLNISTVLFMIPLSLGMALTVLVGNQLGKQNQTEAKLAWKNALYVNLILATFNAAFIYFLGERAVALYSQDSHVIEIATYLLLHAAVFQISDSIQITAAGALRGYNDTLATFVLSLIAFWGVGLPLGYYLGLAQDAPMGAAGFWVGLIIGLTVNAVFLLARLRVVSRKSIIASSATN